MQLWLVNKNIVVLNYDHLTSSTLLFLVLATGTQGRLEGLASQFNKSATSFVIDSNESRHLHTLLDRSIYLVISL